MTSIAVRLAGPIIEIKSDSLKNVSIYYIR
jgi:hypothetical protein